MISSLANILAAFGRKSIEVYEWDRSDIVDHKLADHAAWIDVTTPRLDLEFTGWSLAHAVVRADFLTSGDYGLAGIGFLFQMDRIVDFMAGPNLRLQPGAADALNDVSKTSMIGRVGQGLSILFADQRDYNFLCHLAFDPSVAASLKANKKQEVADFLFENDAGDRMILESKATFTLKENEPKPVKARLKHALKKQVDTWMNRVMPPPAKGFALYSALRERGNLTDSAIAFVDPDGTDAKGDIEIPGDWVRRQNYAAWLAAMGLRSGADRLRQQAGTEARPVVLPIIEVAGRQFAFVTQDGRGGSDELFGLGIELEATRAVEAAIEGSSRELDNYEFVDAGAARPETSSIMGDGSFFGLVDRADIRGTEKFNL